MALPVVPVVPAVTALTAARAVPAVLPGVPVPTPGQTALRVWPPGAPAVVSAAPAAPGGMPQV